ncbi:MAG: hypothetical protein Q8O34_12675 [Rhodocyclaceae bacterium]|nr:hypothetical protein [Rhodocyclaceae bacterium]
MHSVYLPSTADSAGLSAIDGTAADKRAQMEGVARLSRAWLERIPATDPRREHLIRMGILAEDLVKAGDQSPAAMMKARELLCANCRRLDAAEGKCMGQSLDRCLLLKGTNP